MNTQPKTTNPDSALLHAILEATVDAMIISDENGVILRANLVACDLFQYSADELVGQNVSILMPKSMADQHDGFIAHHMKTGEKRIIGLGRDVEGQRKDKTLIPVHLTVGRADVSGQTMFVGILHDLTNRRAVRDALARSQRLDAIGQMTGGIAHDFNNLLTVIIGNLELLDMREPTDRQRAPIQDALDAADLGADLTSRLMIFARKGDLKPVTTDLAALCEDTLSILRRTLGAGCNIKTDFESNLAPVLVDPVQLQSTLMNLALNARDAMDGKGELLVSIANVTIDDAYMAQETDMEPGTYVRISVSDDGAGMTPEAQKRAFEPFFTTKANDGGNGLGLSMVYGFVRQSGGHITLYSELGLGSSFGLYFPAINTEASAAHPDASDLVDAPRGKGQTILIVEDNPKVRNVSIERIQDLGFDTLQAETGDKAYQMLKDGAMPDIVFSDLVMPGDLNGYELAAKVASEFPQIKILLTSGYASDVVSGALAHDKLHDILHKPYRQSELAQKLQALLDDDTSD